MRNKRKGVTLAEMSIVMAVIAIVSLSVVSFVTITSGRGTASIGKLNAMEEIELVEAVVDGWFSIAAQDGEPLNPQSSIKMEGQTLRVIFPKKNEPTDYYLEKVTKVSFSQRFLTESGECKETLADGDVVKDTLYFCTVTYVQNNEDVRETYTFCINPRVGEIVGGNTDGGDTNGGDTNGGDTNGGDTNGGDTNGGDTNGGDTNNEAPGGETGDDTNGGNSGGDGQE